MRRCTIQFDTALANFPLIVHMIELLCVGVLLTCYALPHYQGRILLGAGSDNSVHVFLIHTLRENGYRLFTRVPRIINESYCGAFPLMLHLILSRFSDHLLNAISRHLNPVANLVLCTFTWTFAGLFLSDGLFGTTTVSALSLLALTPQYYHAFSARNFGVSSRALGIFFFVAFQCFFFAAEFHEFDPILSICVCLCGYLIVAFNTFALQAMVFTAIGYALLTGTWAQVGFVLVSLLLFLLAHRLYAASYLKHTLLFINTYRKALASLFILRLRHSIWRDLPVDIYRKFRGEGAQKGASYAYGNSVLILIFLNPVAVLAAVGGWFVEFDEPFIEFCWRISTIALFVFLATSFRATRFLGEPERYVEMATPFAMVTGSWLLLEAVGIQAVLAVLTYQLLAVVAQLAIARKLGTHVTGRWTGVRKMFDAMAHRLAGDELRFGSNNDEIVKIAMDRPWRFARHWSFEMPFAGLDVAGAFREYPVMHPESFAKVASEYDLNAFIIDSDAWNFSSSYSTDLLGDYEEIADDGRFAAFVRNT